MRYDQEKGTHFKVRQLPRNTQYCLVMDVKINDALTYDQLIDKIKTAKVT